MARLLLRGGRLEEALPTVSQRLAQALGLPSAAIELAAVESDERRVAFPLRERTSQIGTLIVPAGLREDVLSRLQVRVVPQLEALLAAALERDELLGDVVETAALRRSDVLKTALLRAVSHDLRSPLTAILTAADALDSAGISPDERLEMTRAIREEAIRLSRLIDNLLDLSRLEADAAEPQREWCSIEEIIESAIDELHLPADTFALSVAPDMPQVRADAAQLDRAFANLLENSARHSGGHPVSVRARAVGERVIVRIVDRGPGIPSAQLERVFQPFYRAGTQRTGHRGSGLGLAIARGFIEVNGGKVWAESLPGQATTFVVEMPLDVPDREPEAEPVPSS
jgi:two-component system sensor histidine kinase KdpD